MPASQLEHVLAPESEYLLAAQLVQLTDDDAPVDPRNVPAMHLEHAEDPINAAYMPTKQLRHEVAPEMPTKAPIAQLVQDNAPVVAW